MIFCTVQIWVYSSQLVNITDIYIDLISPKTGDSLLVETWGQKGKLKNSNAVCVNLIIFTISCIYKNCSLCSIYLWYIKELCVTQYKIINE